MTTNVESRKKFANRYGYSDVDPYEIVRWVSDKTIEVRPMDATRDPNWKPEHIPGGFAGVMINQCDQKWIITSNPSYRTWRIRLSKKGWNKGMFSLSDQPRKFYDYNF